MSKCFTATVTDKALLEKTGGIVQGMSGSPIVQDGKIVGAQCLQSKLATQRS